MKHADSLYTILRGMIREEIDQTPGFRELTSRSDLPAAIDAEVAILGAVMLDNAAMPELQPDDYSLDSHRRIMLCMRELRDAGKPIDIVTLQQALGENGIKEIGGRPYLFSLTEGLPRLPRVDEYVAIVQEKTKLRRIMAACTEAVKSCIGQQETSSGIVEQLGVALKGIRKGAK